MAYTIKEEKTYAFPQQAVFQAAEGAVEGLQGSITKQDAAAGTLTAKFNKTIHGQVLGDRTEALVSVTDNGRGGSQVAVEIYPIDPVGRKLQFGARKGVARTVLNWYWAHVEHRLPQTAG